MKESSAQEAKDFIAAMDVLYKAGMISSEEIGRAHVEAVREVCRRDLARRRAEREAAESEGN